MATKSKGNMFATMANKRKENQDGIVLNAKEEAEKSNATPDKVQNETVTILDKTSEKSKKTPETTTKKETASSKKESPKPEVTSKAGRPKGKPSTKISLNVPNEYLDLVNVAAGINFKGNTSSYIVSLIEKDIKANGKVYQQIKAITEA